MYFHISILAKLGKGVIQCPFYYKSVHWVMMSRFDEARRYKELGNMEQ